MAGSKKIKLDYLCGIWKIGFWVLEAKKLDDGENKPSLEAVGQAFTYAAHPKIDAPYYVVSNGRWLQLFDRDGDPAVPILEIEQKELADRFDELRAIIGADQITFHLKNRLIARVESVLSSDCFPERTDANFFARFNMLPTGLAQRFERIFG
jgi:hypothetical protein